MWFITVFEKIEQDDVTKLIDFGYQRTWGYYSEKECAVKALHENWTDMMETSYNYAVIEEYEEGISNYLFNRQWFKWDDELGGYFEIEEPECVKCYGCYAIG